MSEVAFCALGANLGDREANLERGLELLNETPGIELRERSPWFETGAVGGPAQQPDYLNGVVRLVVGLEPRPLLERFLEIERLVGRDRTHEVRFGPRVLDLDLLIVGDREIAEPGLRVPHPRLEERSFVLVPFAAIAPEWVLASGRTVREAVEALPRADWPRRLENALS